MGRKAEVQRALLEKLMGPEAMGTANATLHFTDDKVCKNFLCGICPNDLFSNTKVDLGPCPRSHTAKLKDDYDAALSKGDRYAQFEVEHENSIRTFMADIDRKIAANKRRIDISPEETAKFTNLMRDIQDLEAAHDAATKEVERLGEAGEIEASLAELNKAEALKQEKSDRERDLQVLSDSAGASGHQKLRVCDVCGAYLSILDSDRRLADHFGGRMHLGYLKLREVIQGFDDRRARGEDPRTFLAQRGPGPLKGINGTSNGTSSGPAPPTGPGGQGADDGYRRREDERDRDRRDRDRERDRGSDRDRERERRERRGGADYR
ncbi:LUC7-domain-containing protein [Ceraceosorus guamensis]|uniref:LUC7-domain-containing protein n=1 Tax=Ceraceosorus guamensis TaxID=1522189 RepID=A0A316VYM0_9BASI|nr:LUC7-domain-containing protein [Ceraceosorus guamensis]PWN41361.1 LUC7-domain-containing protein [Ceraceosorus guamensis]